MIEIEDTATIEVPPDELWSFLMDEANDPKWQTTLTEMRKLTEGPMRLGAKLTEVRRYLGKRIVTTWEVVEHDPPRRSRIRSLSGPIPMSGSYELEPMDTGTRLTVRLELEAGGFFAIAEPVLRRMTQRELVVNMANLKDLLESRAGAGLAGAPAGER